MYKQGVALTGRNKTGPPSRTAPWWITLRRRGVLETTYDRQRQQTPTTATSLAPYTMCRRASNKYTDDDVLKYTWTGVKQLNVRIYFTQIYI